MRTLIVMNHELTEEQEIDLEENLGIKHFWEMSAVSKSIWKNIPPDKSKDDLEEYLKPVISEIEKFDYIILAGELTACLILTDAARRQKIKALTATTKRESIEVTAPNGTVTKKSVFKHVRFREI